MVISQDPLNKRVVGDLGAVRTLFSHDPASPAGATAQPNFESPAV